MRLALKALRLACIFVTPAVALFAGEIADAPSPLPKTVAVAAFKNGLAFVLRQGEIPLTAGTARISPIPSASLGTLWIAPVNPEARIDEIVAYRYNTPTQRPIPSIGEILRANAGKTVTITYQMKEYTGEVVGLKDAAPDPAAASIAPTDARYTPPQQDYLLLRTDKRLMAFPLGGISMANLPDDAVLHETIADARTRLFASESKAAHPKRSSRWATSNTVLAGLRPISSRSPTTPTPRSRCRPSSPTMPKTSRTPSYSSSSAFRTSPMPTPSRP